MKGSHLRSTLREMQTMLSDYRIWLVFCAILALFAATGPFGTYQSLPLHARLGYWLLVHAATWAIALFCIALFDTVLEPRIGSPLGRMMAGAAFASLPMAAVITVINAFVFSLPATLTEMAWNVLTTLPVSLAVSLLSLLALGRTANVPANPEAGRPEAAEVRRPPLLDRLPPDKRGALLRIEVQDHYVLVVTARGCEMLLMRLADAVREAEPAEGMQVHRSHWVARDAVADIVKEPGKNGRTMIRTMDGVIVPVSRGNVVEVREWLATAPPSAPSPAARQATS